MERLRIPVTLGGTLGAPLHLGIELHLPTRPSADIPVVWYGFPGGGCNKRYFDIAKNGDRSRSFAAAMTARGHVVVTLDHLGVGDSDVPGDEIGYDLGALVAADAEAVVAIRARITAGTLSAALPALAQAAHIGVGHSMGGLFVAMQQGVHESFDAVALLGANAGGLEWALSDEEKRYANKPDEARAAIGGLAKARFGAAFPRFQSSPEGASIFAGEDESWTKAMSGIGDRMISVGGLFSMIPFGIGPDVARITVPVFFAFGEHDIGQPARESAEPFTATRDITLMILPGAGHMHFAFPATHALFARLEGWGALIARGDAL